MKSRVVLGLSSIVLAIALAGCAPVAGGSTPGGSGGSGGPGNSGSSGSPGGSNNSGSTPESIQGTWQLTGGTDADGSISPGGASITLKLDGTHSGGQGPCNAFGATASSSTTGAITIRVGIHTMMACSEAVRNVTESRYFAALGKVRHASLAGGTLTLTGTGVSLVFTPART